MFSKICHNSFNGFQMMYFKVFSNNVFQSVFKIPHRFQWFSNCVLQSVFKIPHTFQWFTNCVFQSVFKIPHRFQCFSNDVFQMFSNNVFQSVFKNLPIGFNHFQMMCFKVFSKFPIGFKLCVGNFENTLKHTI